MAHEPYSPNPTLAAGQAAEHGQVEALQRQIQEMRDQISRLEAHNQHLRQLTNDEVISSALTPSGFTLPNQGTIDALPGVATAGAAYGATEQTMLQAVYNLARTMHPILTGSNLAST